MNRQDLEPAAHICCFRYIIHRLPGSHPASITGMKLAYQEAALPAIKGMKLPVGPKSTLNLQAKLSLDFVNFMFLRFFFFLLRSFTFLVHISIHFGCDTSATLHQNQLISSVYGV